MTNGNMLTNAGNKHSGESFTAGHQCWTCCLRHHGEQAPCGLPWATEESIKEESGDHTTVQLQSPPKVWLMTNRRAPGFTSAQRHQRGLPFAVRGALLLWSALTTEMCSPHVRRRKVMLCEVWTQIQKSPFFRFCKKSNFVPHVH